MSIPEFLPGFPFYDRTGAEISFPRYMKLAGDLAYKKVASWEEEAFSVSTVWLGINTDLGEQPMIFETMVFRRGEEAGPCWRYPTEAAAIAGHDQVVAWVRDGIPSALPFAELD